MDKGYIQVYTGNGKGKTTAALGLSLRAVCAGKKVYFGQFAKGMNYSELKVPKFLPNFTMEQFGKAVFIHGKPTEDDINMAQIGFKKIKAIVSSGKYDVVVLDELNIAIYYNLISLEDVLKMMEDKYYGTEIIITGRYANPKIMEKADLVTEMREIKHYYNKGVKARAGIEN